MCSRAERRRDDRGQSGRRRREASTRPTQEKRDYVMGTLTASCPSGSRSGLGARVRDRFCDLQHWGENHPFWLRRPLPPSTPYTMPPKSIFRQPGAQHFQVVHRSQRDPLIHDSEASKHVLKAVQRGNLAKVSAYAVSEILQL